MGQGGACGQRGVQRREVNAEILAITASIQREARRLQSIVAGGSIDEVSEPRRQRRKVVAGRILLRRPARERVPQHDVVRRVGIQADQTFTVLVAVDGVGIVASPGFAASIAAWRFPPALTVIVAADALRAVRSAIARDRPAVPSVFKAICSSCRNGNAPRRAIDAPLTRLEGMGVFLRSTAYGSVSLT
jgi:hypothetical protein